MNTRATGAIGEQIAAEYLESVGFKILERNAKYVDCEVDIICEARLDDFGNVIKETSFDKLRRALKLKPSKKGELVTVFCEVKTRSGDSFGTGAEAVTPYKAGRYTVAAKQYMQSRGIYGNAVRFDIIEVGQDGEVNHIHNAFGVNEVKFPRNR